MAQKGVLTTADYFPIDDFYSFLGILRAEKEHMWELFCYVAFSCQLRCSDVIARRWVDILGKDTTLITEKKTGKNREIELNKNVRKRYNEIYQLMGKPDLQEYIFKSPYTDKPYTIQHINARLKEFKFKYKLPVQNFSTHTFRKTFGRMVYEKSGKSAESLILLNTIFKHSSISVTKAYIGLRKEEISQVYKLIDY
jgi:integrase